MMELYEGWRCDSPCQHYLLLDGAVPEPIQAFYTHSPDVDWHPLYLHTEFEDLLSMSPMLIPVDEESPMLRWFLAGPENWQHGMCVQTFASHKTSVVHLQSILKSVLYGYMDVFFRFHDPSILDIMLPTLTDAEKSRLLGPIYSWNWIGPSMPYSWNRLTHPHADIQDVISYGDVPNELQKKPFLFSDDTMRAYRAAKDKQFIQKVRNYFLEKGVPFAEEGFEREAATAIAQGRQYGLTYESTLCIFMVFWFSVSPDFHRATGIKDIFEKSEMPELEKIELVCDEML